MSLKRSTDEDHVAGPSAGRPAEKKSRSTSCYLCQRRKQKCDQRSPSCTNCIKSKVECVQPPRYGELNRTTGKDEYTAMLEKKVRQLEALLEAPAPNAPSKKYHKIGNLIDEDTHPTATNHCVNNQFVQLINAKSNFLQTHKSAIKDSVFAAANLSQFLHTDPFLNMDPKLAKSLQDLHFRGVQTLFPLFDEADLTSFREKYYSMLRLPPNEHNDYHFFAARMFLISAISALQLNNTGRYKGPKPAQLFSTALRHLILMGSSLQGLHKIQILFLLVFFLSRADKDTSNIQILIADSIRACLELALHKEKTYLNISPQEQLVKLRAIWCTYLLERSICLAISKSFTLREGKIEANVPLFPSDSQSLSFINQSIRIRRIESRFIEQLKILNSISKSQLPQVEKYFQELQNWRNNCQHFQSDFENETLSMFYYTSIRNLVQPYLELLDPENKLFKECQAAAGQICQTIKSFHQKTSSGFSILNIHFTFTAGITLIYCLWLQRNRDDMRRKLLGDDKKHTRPPVSEELFTGLDDLRACSISLYVMSERTRFALSFRDTFEEIMNATIGNLILRCGPDSSEILLPWYSSQIKQNHQVTQPPPAETLPIPPSPGFNSGLVPLIPGASRRSSNASFSSKYKSNMLNPKPPKLRGMPPATVRRPIKNFEIQIVDAPKSEEERKEDETRIKMGKWTRNTIPKGLSHLLSAPSPLQQPPQQSQADSNDGPNDEIIGSPNYPSRLLPPLVSQIPQRPPSLAKSPKVNSPLPRAHASVVSMSPVATQSPKPHPTSGPGSINGWFLDSSLPAIGLPTTTLNNGNSTNNYIVSTPESKVINSSHSNTSDSTNGNMTSYFNPQIPELFPFVGRTSNMINNISVWTGQSGQQIPQTGLQMRNDEPQGQPNDVLYSTNQMNMMLNIPEESMIIPATPYYSDIPVASMLIPPSQQQMTSATSVSSTITANVRNKSIGSSAEFGGGEEPFNWDQNHNDFGFFP